MACSTMTMLSAAASGDAELHSPPSKLTATTCRKRCMCEQGGSASRRDEEMYLEELSLVLAGVELALACLAGLLQLAEQAGGGLIWRRRRAATAEVPLAVLLDAAPVVALVSATLAACTRTRTMVRGCSFCWTWNKRDDSGRAAQLRVPRPFDLQFWGRLSFTSPLTTNCDRY